MKTMKILKLLGFIVFLAIISYSCEKDKETNDQSVLANGMKNGCPVVVVDLIAGQFTDVGSVTAELIGTSLTVTYNIDEPGWCMSLTHLDVQLDPVNFPVGKNGNPKIGHFAYSEALNCATSWTQVVDLVPLGYEAGDMVYIAAHADVSPTTSGFGNALPDCANLILTGQVPGAPSYFPTATITNGGYLNGIYEGWCVDIEGHISASTNYTVAVYSSTEVLPTGTVDKPENFPYVNWILNQGFVGTASSAACSGGLYTYGDVQRAIWYFIDDDQWDPGQPWTECKALEIYNLAVASGAGYVPGCGDRIAIVLFPVYDCDDLVSRDLQTVIIDREFGCDEETAWGGFIGGVGVYQFNQNAGWAMYFDYQCP